MSNGSGQGLAILIAGAIIVLGVTQLTRRDKSEAAVNQALVNATAAAAEMGYEEHAPAPSEKGVRLTPVDSAEYVMLSSKKLPSGRIEVTWRRYSAKSGVNYSRREFDCRNGAMRSLGDGSTREQAERDHAEPEYAMATWCMVPAHITPQRQDARGMDER